MTEIVDALVGGLIAMVVGVVAVLVLSLVVPPPLDLPVLAAIVAAATFLVGVVGSYAMEPAEE